MSSLNEAVLKWPIYSDEMLDSAMNVVRNGRMSGIEIIYSVKDIYISTKME